MDCLYKPGDMLKIRADRRTVHYVAAWAEDGGDLYNTVKLKEIQRDLLIFRGCYSRGVFECDVELAEGPW